ncbi:MAG: UDP-N-acetylglucosamine pyrophosphorylase [Clostridiales bacterium]|nr:UDP-N-acetylglucosamine pyrophosphorylase [Clostridiales bacterium]
MFRIPKTSGLFDLSKTSAAKLFETALYPWEVLGSIADFIRHLGEKLDPELYDKVGDCIYIAKDASVAQSASIKGPCIIESGAEIRHCAYIRGSALIGAGAVVGNSCEIKNALLFNRVQIPHFNYVGDSILGFAAHMGAGAITSNVKSDKSNICINTPDGKITTGLRKFGAILGDFVEVGCNSVLNPGSIIGRHTIIYPLSRVRGIVPDHSIYKDADNIVPRQNV